MGALRKPYLMLRVLRHNTISRTVIQITKKYTTLALQCVYIHKHTCGAEGEVTWPLMTTYGAKFQIGVSELSFFNEKCVKALCKTLCKTVLVLHLMSFLAIGGPYAG